MSGVYLFVCYFCLYASTCMNSNKEFLNTTLFVQFYVVCKLFTVYSIAFVVVKSLTVAIRPKLQYVFPLFRRIKLLCICCRIAFNTLWMLENRIRLFVEQNLQYTIKLPSTFFLSNVIRHSHAPIFTINLFKAFHFIYLFIGFSIQQILFRIFAFCFAGISTTCFFVRLFSVPNSNNFHSIYNIEFEGIHNNYI